MATNEEIREFAAGIDPDDLPRDGTYYVAAARPGSETQAVTDFIDGKYHAMYVRDRIAEEKGHMGVSFHLRTVEKGEGTPPGYSGEQEV